MPAISGILFSEHSLLSSCICYHPSVPTPTMLPLDTGDQPTAAGCQCPGHSHAPGEKRLGLWCWLSRPQLLRAVLWALYATSLMGHLVAYSQCGLCKWVASAPLQQATDALEPGRALSGRCFTGCPEEWQPSQFRGGCLSRWTFDRQEAMLKPSKQLKAASNLILACS